MAEERPEKIDFEDELKHYARAVPFVPFDIVTTSGDTYTVTESLQLALGNSALVLVLPRSGIQVIRKSQITALHVHQTL